MIKIDRERLLRNIEIQGKIGWQNPEGLFREGFTPSFVEVRKFVETELLSSGIPSRIDTLGNIFAKIDGENKDSIILCGSHLDSVKGGGILDGAYGVIAAMEIAQTLKEKSIKLKHSYEMVGFNSEEGSELGGSFGSRGFSGLIKPYPHEELLSTYNLTCLDIDNAKGDFSKYAAFLELHIEQGIVLNEKGISIGVPSAIAGITRYRCIVKGRSNHSGTTPMLMRKDALYETMKQMTKWMDMMRLEKTMVCNIGYINVSPAHICIVPEQTEFTVEIRAINHSDIDRAVAYLNKCLSELNSCTSEISLLIDKPAAQLDTNLTETIYNISVKNGYSTLKMVSGASHDASPISYKIPSAMIFVPSVNGISHAPDEYTDKEDLVKGAQLLLNAIIEVDKTI